MLTLIYKTFTLNNLLKIPFLKYALIKFKNFEIKTPTQSLTKISYLV